MGYFKKINSKSAKGRVPFQKRKGFVYFTPREGVNVDYGIAFYPAKGHRIFFNYTDTPQFKNTWGPDSLRNYAKSLNITADEHRVWRAIFLQQSALADEMNQSWETAGRPANGVPEPKRTMQ